MKASDLAKPAFLALILSLGGCFGGNDAEDDPVGPGTSGGGSGARKLSAGLYEGDYTPYDSLYGLESEIQLSADGTYRFFWFTNNIVVADIQGNWFQRDSNVHFNGIRESYVEGGVFFPGFPVDDDTNAVRQVTETSFIRKEWTPLRQKPLWITYRKKSVNTLGDGSFLYTADSVIGFDGLPHNYRIGVRLDEGGYSEDFLETDMGGDTSGAWLAEAEWYQVGSVFIKERFKGRIFDFETRVYGPDLDSIPGASMRRLKDVGEDGFKLWNDDIAGAWNEYRKN